MSTNCPDCLAKDSAYEKVVERYNDKFDLMHKSLKEQLSSLQSKAKGLEVALEKVKPFLPDPERKIAQEALKCYREEKA